LSEQAHNSSSPPAAEGYGFESRLFNCLELFRVASTSDIAQLSPPGAMMKSLGGPEAAPQAAPARILVAEDDPLIRFAIAEALRDLGASVIEAATADEAWQYLIGGEPVDVIFTDYRMPGSMTGAELAVRVRRQFPALEVVVTSGDFEPCEWTEPIKKKPYPLIKTANDLMQLALATKQKG
jgi:CheY-like chemotaxis protein